MSGYNKQHAKNEVYLNGHYVGTLPPKDHTRTQTAQQDYKQVGSVFHLFMLVLCFIAMFMIVVGSSDQYKITWHRDENNNMVLDKPQSTIWSFETLLNVLEDVSSNPKYQIRTDWIGKFSESEIEGSWDFRITEHFYIPFDWLRVFLNKYVIKVITITLYVGTGLVQTITYFSVLFGYLFGFVSVPVS